MDSDIIVANNGFRRVEGFWDGAFYVSHALQVQVSPKQSKEND